VDAFMRAKRAAGFAWLDIDDAVPVERRRSRCKHEFTAPWSGVTRAEEQPTPPPMVHLWVIAVSAD
jgi:hypothetical protein